MINKLTALLVLFLSVAAWAQQPEGNRLAGLTRKDGFIPFYWDAKKGVLLFELSPQRMKEEFIYFTGLSSGVGSIQMFADRSTTGKSQLCRLVRSGPKVLVVAENTAFRAENGSAELKHSVERSFPTSVIAALPIESEKDDVLIVNANPLALRDVTGLLEQLRRPSRAVNGVVRTAEGPGVQWRLDEQRSTIDMDHTRGFPLNTEIENTLTFTSDAGRAVNSPENGTFTVREHISLLPLPPAGYEPRAGDVRVGFFGPEFLDFSRSYNASLDRRYIARWRLEKLEKKDPSVAISEPVKPIVFYLDRAIPEPIRSAAREGALWWNQAFEQAGFRNALVIEDLPEGADPLDARYSTIQWTNRDGRGWSVGMEQSDPRTGEILHAVVQLDSHRVRTVHNYWNVLNPAVRDNDGRDDSALDLFADLDSADPGLTEDQVMMKRIALLTCHEMGHVLGLEHNFAASTFNRGSVMDYFAPRITIRKDGTADMSDAYMQGVGSYDRFAIEWGYSTAVPDAEQENARLEAVIQKALHQGIFWGNNDDPRWNAYDDGPDPVTWLRQVLPVRDALLKNYSARMLRKGEPSSRLAARFTLVYLFHRYALGSALRVVGGAKIPPSLAGDGQKPLEVWDPAAQREALRLALQALKPEELEISPEVWRTLVQYENHGLSPESYRSSAGYVFSPYDGARSIAETVFDVLLEAQRLERLNAIHHFEPASPSAAEVIAALVQNTFPAAVAGAKNHELTAVVQNQLADRLMILAADDNTPPEASADAWTGVEQILAKLQGPGRSTNAALKRRIEMFLRDPKRNIPKIAPSGAPAGPPI